MDATDTDSVPPRGDRFCRTDTRRRSVTVAVLDVYRGGDAVSVCRLSVQSDRDGKSVTVDMALPAGTPVGALLPTIVDLAEQPSPESPRCWRLDRVSGPSLDESITLAENGVHDGELLVLAASDAPPLGPVRWGPFRTAAEAGSPGDASPFTPGVACIWAAALAALALCTRPTEHPSIHLLVAAIGTCVAAAVAVTGRSATSAVTSVSLAPVSLAAATGFLTVPSGPGPANVFLAAAAAASMSLVLLRWADLSPSTLVAAASFSALVAVAGIVPVVAVVPVATVGATLTVAALGVLALSGRISILLSGLTTDPHADSAQCAFRGDDRAVRGHATLTGLVGGSTCAAALGTVLVAVGCHRHGAPTLAGTGFAAVIGLVLLLRVRTHVDEARRRALSLAGMISVSAAFAIIVIAHPAHVGWVSAALIAIGLGAVRPPRLNAVTGRAVQVLEYAALVAVVPLACWVGGVYAMVRGVSLS
jgi:type VII secretion integral membrane protein EccD